MGNNTSSSSSSPFNPQRDIPDLSGQVVIVTGGNTGLGYETIKALAQHDKPPSRIYLAARSRPKAEAAIRELQTFISLASASASTSKPSIIFLPLDLSSLSSVKTAAETFLSSFSSSSSSQQQQEQIPPRLDILINNAGIMDVPPSLTPDGYEIQFGTNVLGPAFFTELLLPCMRDTACRRNSKRETRVVNLSSATEAMAPLVQILSSSSSLDAELKGNNMMKHRHTTSRYAFSKAADVLWTMGLSVREEKEEKEEEGKVKFICAHPGMAVTNLHRNADGWFLRTFLNLAVPFGTPAEKGAWNQIWCAVSGEAVSGGFYGPVGVPAGGRWAGGGNEEIRGMRDRLWEWMMGELEGR